MRRLEFSIRGKMRSVNVPEHWREMSESQFKAVCRLGKGLIDDTAFYSEFFGLPTSVVVDIDIFNFYVLNSLLEFTREVEAFGEFLVPKVGGFVCPKPNLRGMSFHQFMTIDTYFTWYLQTDDVRFLDSMCAAMYLLPDEEFASLDIEGRSRAWSVRGESDKYVLLVSWTIIKRWLGKAYPHLFPSGDDDAPKRGSRKISNTWLEIFDTLVQDDLTKIESYKKVDAMDVIRIVNRRIKEQKNKK